ECGAGRLVDRLHHFPGPPVRQSQVPGGRGDAPAGGDLFEQFEPAGSEDGLAAPLRPDADADRPALARSAHGLTRRAGRESPALHILPEQRRYDMQRVLIAILAVLLHAAAVWADEGKPLGPVEARKQVGKEITVRLEVKAAKDRLEKRGEIYLDAQDNFKDEKNFAVVITKAGAESLRAAGISDPADHFKGKTIRATGTVKEVDGVPRIEIDDSKQIT